MIVILMVGVAVLATSLRLLLCMLYACNSAKQQKQGAKHRREGDNDQTDQKGPRKKTPKPERKQKGLGANPGHKEGKHDTTSNHCMATASHGKQEQKQDDKPCFDRFHSFLPSIFVLRKAGSLDGGSSALD